MMQKIGCSRVAAIWRARTFHAERVMGVGVCWLPLATRVGWSAYQYGPDGRIAVGQQGLRWHWSGDSPLFTDSGSGVVIYPDSDAYLPTNTSLAISDQELNGFEASEHNSSGYGSWAPPNPFHQACADQSPGLPSSGYTSSAQGAGWALSLSGNGMVDDGYDAFMGTAPMISSALTIGSMPGFDASFTDRGAASLRRGILDCALSSGRSGSKTIADIPTIGCTNSTPWVDPGWGNPANVDGTCGVGPHLLHWPREGGPAFLKTAPLGRSQNPNQKTTVCYSESPYATVAGSASGLSAGVTSAATLAGNQIYGSLGYAPGWGESAGLGGGLVIAASGNSANDVANAGSAGFSGGIGPISNMLFGGNNSGIMVGLTVGIGSPKFSGSNFSVSGARGIFPRPLPFTRRLFGHAPTSLSRCTSIYV